MSNQTTIKADDLEDPEAGAIWRRMPRLFTTRRRLKLTVEEFAARYGLPVDVLRACEDGTAKPDAVAEAFPLAIARTRSHGKSPCAAGDRDARQNGGGVRGEGTKDISSTNALQA